MQGYRTHRVSRRFFITAVAAGALAAAGVLSASTPRKLSRVLVKGNVIVDKSGPLFLVGTNVRGQARNPMTDGQFDDWWTYRDLDAANIKSYGFNVIRLITYWEAIEKSTSPTDFVYDSDYVNKMRDTIRAYNARGIYVIVDLHRHDDSAASMLGKFMPMAGFREAFDDQWFSDTGPASGREHLKRIWLMLSDILKDQPGLLGYDLCNEPHLGNKTTLTDQQAANAWFDIADYVIAALRSSGDNHIAFINFSPHAQEACLMSRTLRDNNVVYEPHFYQGIDVSSFSVTNNELDWLRDNFSSGIAGKIAEFKVPFIMGEFGFETLAVRTGDPSDLWIRNALTAFEESPQMQGYLYWAYVAYEGGVEGGGWQSCLTEYSADRPTSVHFESLWEW